MTQDVAPTSRPRWLALVVLCAGTHDHLRRVDRDRGDAVHPERPRFLTVKPRLGGRSGSRVLSFVGSAGASIGVLAGGVFTQALDWHWTFLVNLPIGVITAALTGRLVEPDRGIGLGQGADIVGGFLVTASLMLGVYTIVGAGDHGWSSAHTLGFGTAAVVLLAGFVARQARAVNPLLPLGIFSSRNVSGANLIQALMVASALGFQFLAALYLQRVLGYGALATGLAFLPITVTIGTVSLGFSARG